MESRACYGYYGEGFGASGESAPRAYRGGYQINTYYFQFQWGTDCPFSEIVEFKAKTFENALKSAKAYARREGCTFLGESPKHIKFNHTWD